MKKSYEVAFKAPKMDYTLEEVKEDKRTQFIFVDTVDQKIHEAKKEEEKGYIEVLDLVTNNPDRPMNLAVMTISDEPYGLPKNKSILLVLSQDQVVIDFVFVETTIDN